MPSISSESREPDSLAQTHSGKGLRRRVAALIDRGLENLLENRPGRVRLSLTRRHQRFREGRRKALAIETCRDGNSPPGIGVISFNGVDHRKRPMALREIIIDPKRALEACARLGGLAGNQICPSRGNPGADMIAE